MAMAAEGMPQLDFSNPLTSIQVVWGAIIFIVLYILLSRWALPQVGEVLDERAATIEADLEAARAPKAQADDGVTELTAATARGAGRGAGRDQRGGGPRQAGGRGAGARR